MKTLDQQILSCMTVRLTERFPGLSPAFSLLSFQETVEKETGTDGSSFYYEKNLLRKAFLEDRLDFLFLHTLSHVLFLHFLPEASVEQEIWNLAADTAASYFVDTYLLPESPGSPERRKIYSGLPVGARSAEKLYSFLLEIPAEERQRFLCCQADDHRHWFSGGDEVFGSFLGGDGSEASTNGSGGTSCPKSPSASRTGQLQRIQKTLELLSLSPLTPSLRKKAAAELLPAAVWSGFFLRKKGVMTSAVISAVSPSPEKRQNRILTALTISRTATDFHSRKSFSFWNRWNTGIPQRYRNWSSPSTPPAPVPLRPSAVSFPRHSPFFLPKNISLKK